MTRPIRRGSPLEHTVCAILVALGASAVADPARALVTTTFDTDLEGWAVYGDNVSFWVAGEGNPDGCLRVEDDAIGLINVATAPPDYLGDWSSLSAADSLVYELRYDPGGPQTVAPKIFRIEGPGGSAEMAVLGTPPSVWNRFAIPIDPGSWTVTSGTWGALMANVTALEIAAEMIYGDEVVWIDNVRLDGAPTAVAPANDHDDFSAGSAGWLAYASELTHVPTGGDTGGFLEVTELADGGGAMLPSWFGGEWTHWDGTGEIFFTWYPPDPIQPGGELLVELLGPGGVAQWVMSTDPLVGSSHLWIPMSVPIDAAQFSVVSGTWSELLAHVQKVRISSDVTGGNDTFALDNVYRGDPASRPAPQIPLQIHEPGYSVATHWPFMGSSALAVNPADGELYTLIHRTASTGGSVCAVTGPLAGFELHTYDRPLGLVFTADGDGFVSENYSGQIFRFVGTAQSTVWANTFHPGDDDPLGLLVAPAGFNGPNVQAGDLLVPDQGYNGTDGIWAVSTEVPHVEAELVPDPGDVDWFDLATDGSRVWACDNVDDDVFTIVYPDGATGSLVLSQNLSDARALVYDSGEQVLYAVTWSAPLGRAYRIDAQTGAVTLVADGLAASGRGNLEIDSSARKLWISDEGESRIYEIDLPPATTVSAPTVARAQEAGLVLAPLPIAASTNVLLQMPRPGLLRVDVLDAAGRRVRRLADGAEGGRSPQLDLGRTRRVRKPRGERRLLHPGRRRRHRALQEGDRVALVPPSCDLLPPRSGRSPWAC